MEDSGLLTGDRDFWEHRDWTLSGMGLSLTLELDSQVLHRLALCVGMEGGCVKHCGLAPLGWMRLLLLLDHKLLLLMLLK